MPRAKRVVGGIHDTFSANHSPCVTGGGHGYAPLVTTLTLAPPLSVGTLPEPGHTPEHPSNLGTPPRPPPTSASFLGFRMLGNPQHTSEYPEL